MRIEDGLDKRGERLMSRHRKLVFATRKRDEAPTHLLVELGAVEAELSNVGLYTQSWRRINAR